MRLTQTVVVSAALATTTLLASEASAQLTGLREKVTGITIGEGINKTLPEQIGAGRGNITTQNSSLYIIKRDPARAVRRGRQLFQRKFLPTQGFSGRDRNGDINIGGNPGPILGAGLVDSCAGCHGRPRGSAGFGGDVFTRPDSRDAPHLFGLGLQEQLGDEMTTELRNIRNGIPVNCGTNCSRTLTAKGVNFGTIARINGTNNFNTSGVVGVDADLRIQPFFAQGDTISIREFLVGAFNAEMGLQSWDPDLNAASRLRQRVVTPSGMVLDGAIDSIEAPPLPNPNEDADGDGLANEIPESLVDFMEFYLLNYFKPATFVPPDLATDVNAGRTLFNQAGCNSCHIASLTINADRRIADVETQFAEFRTCPTPTCAGTSAGDPNNVGNPLNRLFAFASLRIGTQINDIPGQPTQKPPALQPFVVNNFFADLKRHDLGSNFWERNFNGSIQRQFMTEPLWGVGSTAPYGHDGRTHSLEEVIRRHGGEALNQRNFFVNTLSRAQKNQVLTFLNSLVLFGPDDTASNLAPINPAAANFPQNGHGSIALTVLFNNPADRE